MMLRIPAKVLIHEWSYDFYDMMLSTGKHDKDEFVEINSNKIVPICILYVILV